MSNDLNQKPSVRAVSALEFAQLLHDLILRIDTGSEPVFLIIAQSSQDDRPIAATLSDRTDHDFFSKSASNTTRPPELLTMTMIYTEEVVRRAGLEFSVEPGALHFYSIKISTHN